MFKFFLLILIPALVIMNTDVGREAIQQASKMIAEETIGFKRLSKS